MCVIFYNIQTGHLITYKILLIFRLFFIVFSFEVSNHLFFVIFSYSMKGKIYRVTYNGLKQEVELHLENGEIKSVHMTEDEWKEMLKGNIVENFNRFLNE